jgi:hypothetical protein
MYHWRFLPAAAIFIILTKLANSLSFDGKSRGLDRFYAKCPADGPTILRFDPALITNDCSHDEYENETWVAVFRSSLPSIIPLEYPITSTVTNVQKHQSFSGMIETTETPVAIGRLRKLHLKQKWVMDSLRCSLKKENMDDKCDGGSEHAEAISVCVDELLLHFLKQKQQPKIFEASIRCKATLVSGPILENRGFSPVQKLSRDMATHVASLDGSLGRYATRASDVNGIVWNSGPLIRDRTLQIVSLLSSFDKTKKDQADDATESSCDEGEDSDESYDPWAAVKRFI